MRVLLGACGRIAPRFARHTRCAIDACLASRSRFARDARCSRVARSSFARLSREIRAWFARDSCVCSARVLRVVRACFLPVGRTPGSAGLISAFVSASSWMHAIRPCEFLAPVPTSECLHHFQSCLQLYTYLIFTPASIAHLPQLHTCLNFTPASNSMSFNFASFSNLSA